MLATGASWLGSACSPPPEAGGPRPGGRCSSTHLCPAWEPVASVDLGRARIHDGAPVRSYTRVGARELMASPEFRPGCGGTHTWPSSVEHNQCIRLRSSAATRVGPEAALRWPAGVGWRSGMEIQRPWLPLPVKGGRERDVRNRTRGREGRRRGGQGGALVRRRRSDGRPARGGDLAWRSRAMASASCEGERGGDVRNRTKGRGRKKERRAWRRVGPVAELRWAAARGGREARARAARAWRRWLRSAAADTGKCGRVFFVKTVLSDPLKQDCGFISK